MVRISFRIYQVYILHIPYQGRFFSRDIAKNEISFWLGGDDAEGVLRIMWFSF